MTGAERVTGSSTEDVLRIVLTMRLEKTLLSEIFGPVT
jgi:hypothetical protein